MVDVGAPATETVPPAGDDSLWLVPLKLTTAPPEPMETSLLVSDSVFLAGSLARDNVFLAIDSFDV